METLGEFTQKLTRICDKEALTAVHDRLIQYGYKVQSKHAGAGKCGFDIKYSIKSRKPLVQILYKRNKNADFEIHMRPLHVAQYASRFSELSEYVRGACLGGRDCGDCGYCTKAYEYEHGGAKYRKCQFICFNFAFTDFDESDIDSIMLLLNMELERLHPQGT
jgi:hypothetical protein